MELLNILSAPYFLQMTIPLGAITVISLVLIPEYLAFKKRDKKPIPAAPGVCETIQTRIYLLNKEIEETTDRDRITALTVELLKLENHLVSLQKYHLLDSREINLVPAFTVLVLVVFGIAIYVAAWYIAVWGIELMF